MTLKPPPDRLYGRSKGKQLRPRQKQLLTELLPQLTWPENPFGSTPRETWLEVGFGGGEHAYALALANPDAGLVASEVFENGICSLLSHLAPAPPPNLRLYTDDARILLRAMPDATLSKLFLMFPDPWPKARHAKRRFVHPELIAEAARVLRPGGEWRIASDDPTYQSWTTETLKNQSAFTVTCFDTRPPDWPPTRYEAKALAAGRPPLYWSLTRNAFLSAIVSPTPPE